MVSDTDKVLIEDDDSQQDFAHVRLFTGLSPRFTLICLSAASLL